MRVGGVLLASAALHSAVLALLARVASPAAPNGAAIIHDAVTTVHVERDGTAHLDDERTCPRADRTRSRPTRSRR